MFSEFLIKSFTHPSSKPDRSLISRRANYSNTQKSQTQLSCIHLPTTLHTHHEVLHRRSSLFRNFSYSNAGTQLWYVSSRHILLLPKISCFISLLSFSFQSSEVHAKARAIINKRQLSQEAAQLEGRCNYYDIFCVDDNSCGECSLLVCEDSCSVGMLLGKCLTSFWPLSLSVNNLDC